MPKPDKAQRSDKSKQKGETPKKAPKLPPQSDLPTSYAEP